MLFRNLRYYLLNQTQFLKEPFVVTAAVEVPEKTFVTKRIKQGFISEVQKNFSYKFVDERLMLFGPHCVFMNEHIY